MGYYTKHDLTVKNPDEYEDIKAALEKESGYEDSTFEDSVKWYDCDEDCLRVSKMFPASTFAVNGDGEESGDQWQKVYLNGELLRATKAEPFKYPDL